MASRSHGVVSYFGAGVLHIAGLQQAGIGEVLLVDGAAAVVVQVLRDEFFWLCAAALVMQRFPSKSDAGWRCRCFLGSLPADSKARRLRPTVKHTSHQHSL